MSLTGKTALVTGASRGIGRAIAERLAADGALVAVHYGSNEDAARDTVRSIQEAGGSAFTLRAELGINGDADLVLAKLTERLSGPLDILINNASTGPSGPIETETEDSFDRLFAINVKAPFFLVQKLIPMLTDGGRIVSISSGCTRIASPGQTSYAMTKGAIEVLGFTLANALGARGITVNTVSAGATRTDMNAELFATEGVVEAFAAATALGRVGEPADIADAVAFLASPDGRWITGQVLDVSGGIFLGPRG